MTITLNSSVQLLPNQSASALGSETILLNYELGNYYELNEVAGFIWSLLNTQKQLPVREIHEAILEEFDVEPSVCLNELVSFLKILHQEKLIRVTE